jgi:hypothetical protein
MAAEIEIRARITLCYDRELSIALLRSLKPDDIPPIRFNLRGAVEDGCLTYDVMCSSCLNEDLLTLGSILSELAQMSLLVRRILARGCLD